MILSALALLLLAATPTSAAGDAARGGSATTLSSYADYARSVSAECERNRAYGLGTGGLPLKVFCAKLGQQAALQKHKELHPELGY